MDPELVLIVVVAGYLVGSISFARVVGRIMAPDVDLNQGTHLVSRDHELTTYAVNATALGNRAGSRAGMTAGVLDVLKIFIPTIVLRVLYPDPPYFLLFVLAGMVGHVWPVYYRFRGGSGLSVAVAGFLAVDPVGTLVTCLAGTVLGMIVRDAMTTFLGWMWLMIPWLWFRTHDWRYAGFALAVNVIILLAMIPQIKLYVTIIREGNAPSYEEAMQTTGMGRGLYKMGVRMRVLKRTRPEEHEA